MKKYITCLPIKSFFLLIVSFSVSALAVAFIAEYIFGLAPCVFCIIERYPYSIAAVIGIIGLIYKKPQLPLILITVTFFLGTLITTYHVAIEHNIFDAPPVCTTPINLDDGLSMDELEQALMNITTPPPCNVVPIRILGLSIAEYNLLFSLFLFLCVGVRWRYEKTSSNDSC